SGLPSPRRSSEGTAGLLLHARPPPAAPPPRAEYPPGRPCGRISSHLPGAPPPVCSDPLPWSPLLFKRMIFPSGISMGQEIRKDVSAPRVGQKLGGGVPSRI